MGLYKGKRFHILSAGANTGVLRIGTPTVDPHFASLPVKSAFVPFAVRATPHDPISITETGAMMCFLGEVYERYFAHNK